MKVDTQNKKNLRIKIKQKIYVNPSLRYFICHPYPISLMIQPESLRHIGGGGGNLIYDP